jgi:hypothetical protein
MTALNKIEAEWSSATDSYDLKRKYILGQQLGGLNGTFTLNNFIAPDDGVADQLTGAAGNDWFWAWGNDTTDLSIAANEKNRDLP